MAAAGPKVPILTGSAHPDAGGPPAGAHVALAVVRIATWNINSVNRRLEHLTNWLQVAQPDVVCLQETKCAGSEFPSLLLSGLGYEAAAHGTGAWNGVAILSRLGLDDIREGLTDQPQWEGRTEPRAIAATCGPLRVWSLYVPNGRTPDHGHYQYKLHWLDALRATAQDELPGHPELILMGDFNVAPTDDDVFDIGAFAGSTHITQPERDRLTELERAGLTEVVPRPLKYDRAFTYWDYRQLAFPKNNGMRIDLVYASPAVAGRVTDAYSDREARKGKSASDHAPVVVDLADPA